MARNLELEKPSIKDSSVGLLRLISVLINFVVGVVIGLTTSSHVNRYYSLQAEQFYNSYAVAPSPSKSNTNCTIIQSCEKEDCFRMDSFVRPNNLTHEMSDEELFWRASMVPKMAEFPFDRVPKVAFMFLTRGPLPLLPIWERFFKGHEEFFSIYVHTNPDFVLNTSTTSPFNGRQIPSRVVLAASVTSKSGKGNSSKGMARNLELEKPSIKDSSVGLLRLISVLITFVVGVVIGLTTSSHVNRYYSLQAEQFYNSYAVAPSPSKSNTNCTIIQSCEKEDCFTMDSFVRPNNLTHEMSDEELFWRASMVPKMAEFPFHRVPKVAFMFLTRGHLPLLPIWERFFKGHEEFFSIYVHTNPDFVLNTSTTSPFNGRQIPSRNVEWGSVSLVDAEKRLLANALLDFSNDRFVLLSESCIPVYNFPIVYHYLLGSAHSFVQSYDDPSRYGRGRYNRWMRPDIKLSDWRKGSQWFEMNRTVAILTLSDTKYYQIFKKYCRPACYPDEHYIPTFLHMFYGPFNANRTVTWVDWSLGGPHPAKFGRENITEELIQDIRSNGTLCSYNSGKMPVCYLFARKFDPSALEPLLNLTSSVMKF